MISELERPGTARVAALIEFGDGRARSLVELRIGEKLVRQFVWRAEAAIRPVATASQLADNVDAWLRSAVAG